MILYKHASFIHINFQEYSQVDILEELMYNITKNFAQDNDTYELIKLNNFRWIEL